MSPLSPRSPPPLSTRGGHERATEIVDPTSNSFRGEVFLVKKSSFGNVETVELNAFKLTMKSE